MNGNELNERERLDYTFLDFENLTVQALPDHSGIQMVFLFVGEKQNKLSTDIVESMQNWGPRRG